MAHQTPVDVLEELFGRIPLSRLCEALDKEMEDVMWALEVALGEGDYLNLASSERRSRDLAQTLRRRRADEPLNAAFREFARQSAVFAPMLVSAAPAQATGPPAYDELPQTHDPVPSQAAHPQQAQPSPPLRLAEAAAQPRVPPPTSVKRAATGTSGGPAALSQTSTRASSAGGKVPNPNASLPEITSRAHLTAEINRLKSPHAKPLVVLFVAESDNPFMVELAEIVHEHKGAKFMFANVGREGMVEVKGKLSLSLFPTTLVFVGKSFYRTVGPDIASVKHDIELAVTEQVMAAASIWPQAPKGWSEIEAVTAWQKLPNNMRDVHALATRDHFVRNRLYHMLPFAAALHLEAHDALQARVAHFCAHNFQQGDTLVSCHNCGVNGQFANYCNVCFEHADHSGHIILKRQAPQDGLICDCGRIDSLDGSVIGAHCNIHHDSSKHESNHGNSSKDEANRSDSLNDDPDALMALALLSLLPGGY